PPGGITDEGDGRARRVDLLDGERPGRDGQAVPPAVVELARRGVGGGRVQRAEQGAPVRVRPVEDDPDLVVAVASLDTGDPAVAGDGRDLEARVPSRERPSLRGEVGVTDGPAV